METQTPNNSLLSWQAPAAAEHERGKRWYAVTGIFALALASYGLITHDFLLTVVILLTAGVYFLFRNQSGKKYGIAIHPLGIEIDGRLAEWKKWNSFWILIGPSHGELHIMRSDKKTEFIVLTDPLDPFIIRDTLHEFLPYDGEKKEKLFDAFIRFCKI